MKQSLYLVCSKILRLKHFNTKKLFWGEVILKITRQKNNRGSRYRIDDKIVSRDEIDEICKKFLTAEGMVAKTKFSRKKFGVGKRTHQKRRT